MSGTRPRGTCPWCTGTTPAAGAPPEGPAPLGAPLSIAAYADRLRRDEGGAWLVVERRSRRVFGS